jgi:hypothetical protein
MRPDLREDGIFPKNNIQRLMETFPEFDKNVPPQRYSILNPRAINTGT